MKKTDKRIYLIPLLLFSVIIFSGCGRQPEIAVTPTPTISGTDTPSPGTSDTDQAISEIPGLDVLSTLEEAVPTRTPEPTATQDALSEEVSEIVQETGLSGKTLLWLGYGDWINLGISLLYVLVGYLIGTWLIRWLFPRIVSRTKTTLDDHLLQVSGSELRWLAVVIILRFSTNRLVFIHAEFKSLLTDLYFFLILFLIVVIVSRLINLAVEQAEERARKADRFEESDSLITLAAWGMRMILIIVVVSVLLVHFGVNITGIAVFLGVIGLVISLAGRDILADVVSGAIILIDRPFRIGDRLDLPSLNSWGDVVDIGMRSTKILSVENRMVVIPNSQIGKNQVVNYSYPDPSYFNTLNVVVAYDNDPDQVANIIEDAIRTVEGVQTERDVLAWLIELDEYHMLYWASWWVASYADRYPVQNQVSRAIVKALNEAGVVLPYQKGKMNVQVNDVPPEIHPLQEDQS